MTKIWSEDNRMQLWKEVEVAVCDARAERGEIPAEAAQQIRSRAQVSAEQVRVREEKPIMM